MWEVRNNRKDYDTAGTSTGTMSLIGSQGVVLGTQTVEVAIPADSVGYVTSPELILGNTLQTGGSRIESFRLDFTNVNWNPVNDTRSKYKYDVAFVGQQAEGTDYPRHSFSIAVSNSSDFVMNFVRVFGIFLDTQGNLVDVAYSNSKFDDPSFNLPYGESRTFAARSLSQTGRCLGPRDPKGYILKYWVTFSPYDGGRVTRYSTLEIK